MICAITPGSGFARCDCNSVMKGGSIVTTPFPSDFLPGLSVRRERMGHSSEKNNGTFSQQNICLSANDLSLDERC